MQFSRIFRGCSAPQSEQRLRQRPEPGERSLGPRCYPPCAVLNRSLTHLARPVNDVLLPLPQRHVDNSNLFPRAYRLATTAYSAASKINHAQLPGPSRLPETLLAGATVKTKVARQLPQRRPSTGLLLLLAPFFQAPAPGPVPLYLVEPANRRRESNASADTPTWYNARANFRATPTRARPACPPSRSFLASYQPRTPALRARRSAA